ncbi:hypothetical protein DF117_35130 [Burkholderia stagnalis]|nr:hypothetical protein DF119_31670 [Burkholderia stagnalis]RQY09696.1 hypothetical protein DF117_35130 [Burkholderia stagnalis]RQY28338.1 hypothetical protein DF116_34635 [Burkholderia stagnalis]RQY42540.1 hypothetical protein DF112_34595 [Burkholderia stagnalis]RQY68130.1 hypothetical protein DF108_34910 [Burkholderia stagnalis]
MRLMRTFDSPSDLHLAWECKPDEMQVARACAAKGLLNIVGAPPKGAYFEIRLTADGIAVARAALMPLADAPATQF